MTLSDLSKDLQDILLPQTCSERKIGDKVTALNLSLAYPVSLASVQQAALLLDAQQEALLHLDLPQHAVLEVRLHHNDFEETTNDFKDPDDVEISLQYFADDKVLENVITNLYKYFHGIKVCADRRATTDNVAALVVDGCRTVMVDSFARGMDNLSAFVSNIEFIGKQRLTMNVKLTPLSRKRKRAANS